jgi:hypothetical protein
MVIENKNKKVSEEKLRRINEEEIKLNTKNKNEMYLLI